MASMKAAHACLKDYENANTPALLGEDRRDGETVFDPNTGWTSGTQSGNATRMSYRVVPSPPRLSGGSLQE